MRILAAALLGISLLFAGPSQAANELQGLTISDLNVRASNSEGKLTVEKLSEADAAKIDAKMTSVRPVIPSDMYLVIYGEAVLILLVQDGEVKISTDAVPKDRVWEVLGRREM